MKRFLSVILTVAIVMSVIGGVDMFALAAGTSNEIDAKFETLYNLPSSKSFYSDDKEYTNTGGLSVASAANKLYVVKVSEDEKRAVIRYYEDLYTTKTPVKIYFYDGLLRHANGMAIDARYLYIIKQEDDKQVLIRLKRSVLNTLNKKIIRKKDLDSEYKSLYSEYVAKCAEDTKKIYNYKINVITKYSTNEKNTKTSFIVNYKTGTVNKNNQTLKYYTIATLENGVFKVSSDKSDKFAVKLEQGGNLLYPDIFYSKKRGLFIPTWSKDHEEYSYINCYGVNNFENRLEDTVLEAKKVFVLNGNKKNKKCFHFEIESVSMIERNKNKVESDNALYLIFSVNTKGSGYDSVEKITNSNGYLKKCNFD